MITMVTTEKPDWYGKWQQALKKAPGTPYGERKLVLFPAVLIATARVESNARSFRPASSQQPLKNYIRADSFQRETGAHISTGPLVGK